MKAISWNFNFIMKTMVLINIFNIYYYLKCQKIHINVDSYIIVKYCTISLLKNFS